MANFSLRLGCFLTGYKYQILKHSSEMSVKSVKRYTSGLLIISMIWAFIGYSFVKSYFHGSVLTSAFGGAIFAFVIIQIERQIILSVSKSYFVSTLRLFIAIMMACLGALIFDQIVFKDDIDLAKTKLTNARIDSALIPQAAELKRQIATLDTVIANKEREKDAFIDDIEKHPTTPAFSTQTSIELNKTTKTDSTGHSITTENSVPVNTTTSTPVPNAKIELIGPLQKEIETLRDQKSRNVDSLLKIRPAIEKEIKSKNGLLDELQVMYGLITGSKGAMLVWILWFSILLCLEMLIVATKFSEKEDTDYILRVKHEMSIHAKRLRIFDQMAANYSDSNT